MILFENTSEVEKFALITLHGLMTQVNRGLISIDNAEHIFLTPYIMSELERLGVNASIIDLIRQGIELENLEDFNISVKDETEKLIIEIERLLREYRDVAFTEKILTELTITRKNP